MKQIKKVISATEKEIEQGGGGVGWEGRIQF